MTTTNTIHDVVREHYAERIKSGSSCCGPDNCCSTESNLYPADLLATLPEGESTVSYGCGDPITLASLQPGQTVLDLGSAPASTVSSRHRKWARREKSSVWT